MNAHNLNQSGKQITENAYSTGDRVYFYSPRTQQDVEKSGADAKPNILCTTVDRLRLPSQYQVAGRRRQFELTFRDRTYEYKRDVATIITERTIKTIDTDTFEVTDLLIQHAKPSLYDPSYKLQEETLINNNFF
jgi:hypothetical protein